jgi:hypothetical protein
MAGAGWGCSSSFGRKPMADCPHLPCSRRGILCPLVLATAAMAGVPRERTQVRVTGPKIQELAWESNSSV